MIDKRENKGKVSYTLVRINKNENQETVKKIRNKREKKGKKRDEV